MRVRIVLFAAVVTGWLGFYCRRVDQFLFPIPHFLDWLLVDAANGFPRKRGRPLPPLNFLDHLLLSICILYRQPRLAPNGTHFFDDWRPPLGFHPALVKRIDLLTACFEALLGAGLHI